MIDTRDEASACPSHVVIDIVLLYS